MDTLDKSTVKKTIGFSMRVDHHPACTYMCAAPLK